MPQPAKTTPSDLPDVFGQVAVSVKETLAGVWSDFLAHLPFFAAGIVIILLTWLAASLFKRFSRRILRRWKLRGSLRDLIAQLITIGVWAAGLLLTAMIVFPGLTPAKALGALGLVSIAVGFAFKDIFENFFAGILLLWRFPFETGDYIECEGIMGKVEKVMIRMTTIRKTDDELVVVPNGFLFKNPVHILTNQPKRRVTIMAGVAYGEDVAQSVDVIEGAVRSCGTVDGEHDVQVFPQGFGASSIDIEVAWWTDPTPLSVRRSRGEVVTAIKKALDEAGIEIPFPYRTLTFKESLGVEMKQLFSEQDSTKDDGDRRRASDPH